MGDELLIVRGRSRGAEKVARVVLELSFLAESREEAQEAGVMTCDAMLSGIICYSAVYVTH